MPALAQARAPEVGMQFMRKMNVRSALAGAAAGFLLFACASAALGAEKLYDLANKTHRLATSADDGDKTDATFSPDARYIVYRGEYGDEDGEYLLAAPLNASQARTYRA
jgi:hypothetical protein